MPLAPFGEQKRSPRNSQNPPDQLRDLVRCTKELLQTSRLAAFRNLRTWTKCNLDYVTIYTAVVHQVTSSACTALWMWTPSTWSTRSIGANQSLEAAHVAIWRPKRTSSAESWRTRWSWWSQVLTSSTQAPGFQLGARFDLVNRSMFCFHTIMQQMKSLWVLISMYMYCTNTYLKIERQRDTHTHNSCDSMRTLPVFSSTRMRAWARILRCYPIMYGFWLGSQHSMGSSDSCAKDVETLPCLWHSPQAVAPWLRTCGMARHKKLPVIVFHLSQEPELIEALQNKTIAGALVVVLLQPRKRSMKFWGAYSWFCHVTSRSMPESEFRAATLVHILLEKDAVGAVAQKLLSGGKSTNMGLCLYPQEMTWPPGQTDYGV